MSLTDADIYKMCLDDKNESEFLLIKALLDFGCEITDFALESNGVVVGKTASKGLASISFSVKDDEVIVQFFCIEKEQRCKGLTKSFKLVEQFLELLKAHCPNINRVSTLPLREYGDTESPSSERLRAFYMRYFNAKFYKKEFGRDWLMLDLS